MFDLLTNLQVFALIGLVLLVSTLVLGEMFERAIQRGLEEQEPWQPDDQGDGDDRK